MKSRDRIDPAYLDQARQVADAILYEGYLLYPYRASAQKNQERFQFGVLMPPAYRAVDEHEPSAAQTECILECAPDARVTVLARFLQVRRRTVLAGPAAAGFQPVRSLQAGGIEHTPWDEAAECEQQAEAPLAGLLDGGTETEFTVPGGTEHEDLAGPGGEPAGRLDRQREPLHGVIRLSAERMPGPYGELRLQVVVENRTEPPGPLARRADGLPYALIAAHCLIAVPGGRFLSMTEPPEWAAGEVGRCVNTATWPVLAGPPDCTELMLSSPVILYDHAEIAAESAGQLFDSTEIDEILTLRTMTLTDEEKRAARATDPRAAELLDRLDHLPPEMLERMHGAIRYLNPAGSPDAGPGTGPRTKAAEWPGTVPEWSEPPQEQPAGRGGPPPEGHREASGDPAVAGQAPWWDPGADRSVSPETDHITIAGVRVARGSRVRMRPGRRRADAQDLFLAGRTALVEAVLFDVDGHAHLALVPDDDPGADLQRSQGRFLYFAPDEVEPLGAVG
ncbi:MAG: hypothetical protein ACRDND_06010 [Streptosporangiaceae bacterium]